MRLFWENMPTSQQHCLDRNETGPGAPVKELVHVLKTIELVRITPTHETVSHASQQIQNISEYNRALLKKKCFWSIGQAYVELKWCLIISPGYGSEWLPFQGAVAACGLPVNLWHSWKCFLMKSKFLLMGPIRITTAVGQIVAATGIKTMDGALVHAVGSSKPTAPECLTGSVDWL